MKYLIELEGINHVFEIYCLVGGGEEFTFEAENEKEQPVIDWYLEHANEKEIEAILNNIKSKASIAQEDAAELMYDERNPNHNW